MFANEEKGSCSMESFPYNDNTIEEIWLDLFNKNLCFGFDFHKISLSGIVEVS